MPDGVVQWFDPKTGEGRILCRGRRYAVDAGAMESSARVPGARVHFDTDRARPGRAYNVTLRPGTRTSRRQHHFGDLAGVRAPDTKGTAPFSKNRSLDLPKLGRDLQHHPKRVAERWSSLIAAGDLDDAILLYAPHASLHAGGEVHVGTDAIRRFWASSPVVGGPTPTSIEGEDGDLVVLWAPTEPDSDAQESRLRVAHGEILEQWHAAVTEVEVAPPVPAIQLSIAGGVPRPARRYAVEKIGKVLGTLSEPVLYARVRLVQAADPARARPSLARVSLDVNGQPVRAHVAGQTMTEAIDLLERRLRHRLEAISEHRAALRRRGPETSPGTWRHGDQTGPRPPYFPRPVSERAVVRHKTFSTPEATVDEAVFDLESLDYDFLLFSDLATGQDALAYRQPGGSYGLRLIEGSADGGRRPAAAVVEVDQAPVPTLSLDQAREHLDHGHEPWVFFRDAGTGRGRVLYRRYDGHYGELTPADEEIDLETADRDAEEGARR